MHDEVPRVAKLEIFLGRTFACYSDLRPFCFARLVTFETTFRNADYKDEFVVRHAKRSLVCLVLEVLRLRWPPKWLANIMLEFPYYRRNWFANTIRRLGVLVRKNHLLVVWCNDPSGFFKQFDASSEVAGLVDHAFATCVAMASASLGDVMVEDFVDDVA
jgi:hypothetical protein